MSNAVEEVTTTMPPALLVSASYDGMKKCAVLKFYEPKSQTLKLWYDNTGHKPYCYSKLDPEELKFLSSRTDVVKLERVQRQDLLKDRMINVTKITVSDPLAIGGTQTDKSIRNIMETWESDIKYYENYLYDNSLIVGRYYSVEEGKLKEYNYPIPDEVQLALKGLLFDKVTNMGIIDSKEFQNHISEWANLLNQPIPNIKRITFDIEVESETGRLPDAKIADKKITAIGFCASDDFKAVFVLKRAGRPMGTNELPEGVKISFYEEDKEADMIKDAFKILESYPFVMTFNGDDFDMPFMYNRAERLGVPLKEIPLIMMRDSATLKKGVHIDLYRAFSNRSFQIYAFSHKYNDFSLNSICEGLIEESKTEYEGELEDLSFYELANYCFNDARITQKLTSFNNDLLMNLLVVITRIGRMPIDDISRMGVSQWIRSLFYYEHRKHNFLIPRRDELDLKSGAASTEAIIKDKKYRGGLVVEPTEGIHFNVSVMDFASLYPSIIKVRNLSYETVRCTHDECKKNTIPGTSHWVCTKKNGLTAMLIGSLRDLRVNYYKSLSKNPSLSADQKQLYTVVSQALKVILNASYGVMGAEIFPLYCLPVAEATTAVGRYTILETIEKCKSSGIEVLYGDSVLPDTPIIIRRKGVVDVIPIESLMPQTVTSSRYNKFGDVEVLTEKGFTKIKYVYRHKVKKKGYRVLTRKGFVECTEDHSLVIDGNNVKPSELKSGDKINLIKFKAESKVNVSPDLSWLFGLFIAEGTCGIYTYEKNTKNSWRIVNQNKKLLQKAQKIILEHLSLETSIVDIRKSSSTYALVPKGNHKLFVDYFRFLCYRGDQKGIPQSILNANIEAKKAFINGMLEGDGHTDINGLTILDQIHKTVMTGIVIMLEQLGLEYSLQIRKDKLNVCRLRIIKDPTDTRIKQSDIIKKIETFDINGYVYDLETKNHHFCGGLGNILLHNTDSLFLKAPSRDQVQLVVDWAKIEFGVDLDLDKEYRYVVFSTRKKNYLGVQKDGKVDVKGLTGKKSHTPPFIRHLFYEILDILSQVQNEQEFSQSKAKIGDMIAGYAKRLKAKQIPLTDLAFNVMISKAPSEYVKTIPQHIRAAKLLEQTREIKKGDIISYVKIINKPGVKPVEMARPDEIDTPKYMEFMESTFDQILSSMDLDFASLIGAPKQTGLDQFFWK
jgi:DNA polymerase I